jgi:VanZ family protein
MRHVPAVPGIERSRQIRAWVAVALWIGVILALSTEPFSTAQTGRWLYAILRIFDPDIRGAAIHAIHATIRRSAHVVAYGVLALLTLRALRLSLAGGFVRQAAAALTLVASVAIADEVHQSTTTTREGSRVDVALDLAGGSGALAGLALLRAVRRPRAEA